MRKYVLTSQMFEGSVTFGFNDEGWLTFYNNEANFDNKQHAWLLDLEKNVLPREINGIQGLALKIKGKLQEVPPDLTFDAFWNSYTNKKNRKRSEGLWNKMNESQRLKCILSVQPYLNYLNRIKWRNQADPDTYLRNEGYDTDWNKQMK
ncbi:hypothetical protein FM120_11195 [Sphingobacterium faecium PCAi_F2.5]|nr:hypothetical protein FM120_11195 [Sphingobacterium faecium PCAi_F2.5]